MQKLRAHALAHSLAAPTNLADAVERVGFIQADPIRAPATAQDLILRQRVQGYRAGDLARAYPSLGIEEGYLYAYGFMRRDLWEARRHVGDPAALSEIEQAVLTAVRNNGPTHPKELEAELGKATVMNAWGGQSKATTHALDILQWRGFLRVVRRENGIRVYEAAPVLPEDREHAIERFRKLVIAEAHVMAPVPLKGLHFLASGLRRISFPEIADHKAVIKDMLRAGELEQRTVDSIAYVWPATTAVHDELPRQVRFLAPFDPLVWDRDRFEHFWNWTYRFEAYTPAAKRVRGYYALPLLWGDEVIGWANASRTKTALDVEVGFVDKRPKGREFTRELDAEIARLEAFLGVTASE